MERIFHSQSFKAFGFTNDISISISEENSNLMRDKAIIRLGVIGLGKMGIGHAKRVQEGAIPGLQLAAVADSETSRTAGFHEARQFRDGEDLISSGCADAVLIATPHYSHTPLGIAAHKAGLHVLVEKPISAHKEDCEKLLGAYRPDSGQVFAAMFNMRTDPRYCKLRKMLADGTIGQLHRIHWVTTDWFRPECYYRSGQWRATWSGEGGGVLLNQCPHNLDKNILGLPSWTVAKSVSARISQPLAGNSAVKSS